MTDVSDPNPYTSPSAVTTAPEPGLGPLGPARAWTPIEAIEFSWNAVRQGPMIVLLLVVAGIVTSVPDMIGGAIQTALMLDQSNEMIALAIAVRVLFMLVGLGFAAWITLGKSRVKLEVCRGGRADFAKIFAGGALWSVLGAFFLLGLAMLIGLAVTVGPGVAVMLILEREELGAILVILGGLLFAVPALVISWRVQFFPFLIVERGASAVQSIVASWRLTEGQLFGLFVLWLLTLALGIAAVVAGLLACVVGLIVTLPTALAVLALAQSYIYLKLSGEEPVLTAS
jgi:hypothetical protein